MYWREKMKKLLTDNTLNSINTHKIRFCDSFCQTCLVWIVRPITIPQIKLYLCVRCIQVWNKKTLLWRQFRDETAKCVENDINTTDSWRNNWQIFIKFGLLFPHTTLVKIKNVSYKYQAVFAKKLCEVSIFPKCTLYVKLPTYRLIMTKAWLISHLTFLWPLWPWFFPINNFSC